MSKWLLSLLVALTYTPLASAGLKDILDPVNLEERLLDEVAVRDIGVDLNLVDLEVFDGINTSLKYRYEVEPSYQEGYYTKIDRWTVKTQIRPGDILGLSTPLYLNIDRGTEIIFARQIKAVQNKRFLPQREALKTVKPYTLKNLPVTAQRAVDHLKPGDYVSFQAQLNLVVGARTMISSGFLPASADTHYLLSGQFQIHCFRLKDNRLRVKFIALRQKDATASVSGGVNRGELKVFSLRVVGDKVAKFVNTDFFQIRTSKQRSEVFMLDYVFNFNDQRAVDAYNGVISSTKNFKSVKALNPFRDNKELTEVLISDFSEVEDVFEQEHERNVPKNKRAVDRIFMGRNNSSALKNNFKVGLNFVRIEDSQVYTMNKVAYVDRDGQEKHYLFPNYASTHTRGLIFSLFKSQTTLSGNGLFGTNSDYEVVDFLDLGFNYERRDKLMREREFDRIKERIRLRLPAKVYNSIDWKDWSNNRVRRNTRVSIQTLLHPDALALVGEMTKDELRQSLVSYLKGIEELHVRTSDPYLTEQTYICKLSVTCRYKYDIELISENLTQTFSVKVDSNERLEQFVALKDNELFKEVGLGFLISLLPEAELDQLLAVVIRLEANDTEALTVELLGDTPQRELYQSLLYVQSVLNNRSFDMRTDEYMD